MNNEKEIEEKAKAIDYVIYQYSSDPNTLSESHLSECIAHDLVWASIADKGELLI